MSGETLRRAAALMRERAGEASPSPWTQKHSETYGPQAAFTTGANTVFLSESFKRPDEYRGARNAEHIASWHPAVASLIALALNQHADVHDSYDCVHEPCAHVLAARAYLGEQA